MSRIYGHYVVTFPVIFALDFLASLPSLTDKRWASAINTNDMS
jgi:hypothetical protein